MILAAINRLVGIGEAKRPIIDEASPGKYTDTSISRIQHPTAGSHLKVWSLDSLVQYLTHFVEDGFDYGNPLVHVVNPWTVTLSGPLNADGKRNHIMTASCERQQFAERFFNDNHRQDEFMLALQTAFHNTQSLADVMKLCGNLSDRTEDKTEDDGITQTVTVQRGVVRFGEISIKNPVILTPIRTFSEVGQIESSFILRIHSDPLRIALHDGDGDAWKPAAVASLISYLKDNLGGVSVI